MIPFLIDRKVIGTAHDLLCTGDGLSWSDSGADGVLRWYPGIDTTVSDSLNVALLLAGHTPKFKFEQKYVDSLSVVLPGYRFNKVREIPWHAIAPTKFATAAIKRLVEDIKSALSSSDVTYYTDVFTQQNDLFVSLKRAHINVKRLEEVIRDGNRKEFLEEFRPGPDGFADAVTYNRLQHDDSGTKTGRLTIASGPSYMTLNREYRNIIDSRWPKGSVWYLDYSSLEPRTFSAHLGRSLPSDFYNSLAGSILGDTGRTQDAKAMFLRRFYGAGYDVMAADGSSSLEQARKMAKHVDDDFGVKGMVEKLVAEALATGKVLNKFGRSLAVGRDCKPHVIFNNWTQSSAVDAALLGFSKMCRAINKSDLKIAPVCVIHDAMVVDVHPDCEKYLPVLAKVGSRIAQMGDFDFPMHIERIT